MKKTFASLLIAAAVMVLTAGSSSALDDASSFVSGKEWVVQMTAKEKMMSLLPPMALYHKFGVKFQKSIFEYIDTMDTELASNPVLQQEDIANIFASTIYAGEPENRQPMDRMGAIFEILKKRDAENLYPAIPLKEE